MAYTGSKASAEEAEIKRLRRVHPYYADMISEWGFFLSAYEGGKAFASADNIFKHVRENEEDYNERVDRCHNLNYCEPIVDFFTNFIFSEPIDRNGGSSPDDTKFFTTFITDVNKKGDSIDDFMRHVCDAMQIYGMSYILVDSPQQPADTIITKADEADLGYRPYWVLINPEEIVDWSVDDFLKFMYVKRRQSGEYMDGTSRVATEIYTEMYQTFTVVTTVDVSVKTKPKILSTVTFPNLLGEIPLTVARYKTSKRYPYAGLSFLRDFAYNQREIMNLTSLLQEFLYRQAFNVLAKEVDSTLPMMEQQEGTIGTANVLEIPKGAKMPQYLSPPADPAKFIQDERSRIKNEMFMRAAQDSLTELFNGEKASGFSQAQSFSKTVPFISSRADVLERVENRLMALTMRVLGREWFGKIRYKDRYEVTNLTDYLTQLLIILNDLKLPSELFVKEQLKRVVNEFDSKLPGDVKLKVMHDIDTMDFTKWSAESGQPKTGAAQIQPALMTMEAVRKEAQPMSTGPTGQV